MKICLVVEGAYPYVNGGVSSWLQQMLIAMPDIEFVIQVITAGKDESREFKYLIPDNVSEIHELRLIDDDIILKEKKKKIKLTEQEYQAFESLMFGENINWKIIFNFFKDSTLSLNAFFNSEDFLKMTISYYQKHFDRVVFSDFLWTMRSMYLPLFTVLKGEMIEADIYHAISTGYAGVVASMQKIMFDKKMILTEHGIYTREREEEIIKASWVKSIYKDLWISQFRKLSKCSYENADVVTSLFNDARNFQIDLGCEPEKTVVIPNGIDVETYRKLEPKTDHFIHVGAIMRVTPIKDVKTLIIAFGIAKKINPELKLWIMGSLDESDLYAKECQLLVDEMDIKDIEFTGMVNVKDYLGKMDMIVLSSISEGQPLSILEAYAASKPVIATNVGNCRGLIEGDMDDLGQAGIVIPVMSPDRLAQAILKLADNQVLREEMGRIGLQRVSRNYTSQKSYSKYRKVYESMVESGCK